jgi:hypothetical protein
MWRVGLVGRIGAVGLCALWLALAVGVTLGGGVGVGVFVVMWASFVCLCLGVRYWAFVPYIALTETAVVIQNRMSSARIDYREIASAHSGDAGITIVRRDGTRVNGWAVQKSNAAKWTNKTTRSDQVVAAITSRIQCSRTEPDELP